MTSPSSDARRTAQGPSRRTIARGAAWTLPVVAIASAAPSASASPADLCKPCADVSKLHYKGANFSTLPGEIRGTAWFGSNHSDSHHVYIDINVQVGSECVTASPTPPGYAYTAIVGDASFPKTTPTLDATLTGLTIHTTPAAMVSGVAGSFAVDHDLEWGNGEHLHLASVDTNGTTTHLDNTAVAYVTGTLTIGGTCKYLMTITPSVPVPADHHGPIASVTFSPIA